MGFSRERHQMERTPEHIPAWLGGAAPPLPFRISGLRNDIHPVYTCTYRCLGTSGHAVIPIRVAYDCSHGFTIPPFAMYDCFFNAYDHMMHFNQAMILSAGNDRLLCKVFPASLKGPALAWFHKLPRGSINSFDELWATFVSQYLCSVRQKGNISSLQTILKREDESIWDFTKRFRQAI